MRKLTGLGTFIIFTLSCNEQMITDKYQQYKVEGKDRFGNSRICFNDPDMAFVSQLDPEEEEFAKDCFDAGNIVHKCGQNQYVCEQKTYTGIDINGETRSCTEMSQATACTLEFTEGDQYALDCEKNNGTPLACGCHDFICVYKDNSSENLIDKPIEEKTFLGTNQDGVRRSCIPHNLKEEINCPTEINRFHVFAQNCQDEGHEAIWCSCQEVLCLDQLSQ